MGNEEQAIRTLAWWLVDAGVFTPRDALRIERMLEGKNDSTCTGPRSVREARQRWRRVWPRNRQGGS